MLEQVLRALVADARRAGNVVDGVAHERQQVGHLVGAHAHELLDLGGVVPGVVLGGIEHRDPVGDELQHVLVAGHDDHVEALLLGAAGDGADHVVGLEARVLQDRDAHGFEHAADVGDLVGRSGGISVAVGLVLGEFLRRAGWARRSRKSRRCRRARTACDSFRSMLLKM